MGTEKSGDDQRKVETSGEKRRSPVKRIKSDQEDIRRIFSKKLKDKEREKFGFRHSMSSSWRVRETNRELGRDLGRELDGETDREYSHSVRDRVKQKVRWRIKQRVRTSERRTVGGMRSRQTDTSRCADHNLLDGIPKRCLGRLRSGLSSELCSGSIEQLAIVTLDSHLLLLSRLSHWYYQSGDPPVVIH